MPLEENGGLRILTLCGTPEEMGAEHGTLLRDMIQTYAEHFLRCGAEKVGVPFDVLCRRCMQSASSIPVPYVREMKALAEASGTPFEIILAFNCLADLDATNRTSLIHCTNFVAGRSATVGGLLIHGRNLDFLHMGILPKMATVFIRRPAGESFHATVGMAWAGYVGFLTGYSAAQVSVGEVSTRVRNPTLRGIPLCILLRGTLESSSTLGECTNYIERHPRTCGYNLVFCSGREDDALVCECTPAVMDCRFLQDDRLVASGFCMTKAVRSPTVFAADVFRHARLTQLLGERKGTIDVATSISCLRDRYDLALGGDEGRSLRCLCSGYTLQSVVFLPAERKVFVAQGNIPAPLGTYHELSVADL